MHNGSGIFLFEIMKYDIVAGCAIARGYSNNGSRV
jgi:hypothetical protein